MVPSLKVLYVEDEPDIRAVAEFALEDEGFELISCASGQEALVMATRIQPDLILLDVMMPGLDGPSTLRQLRDLPSTSKTPAIFMTAKVQPHEMAEYLAMGAIGVIGKPFEAMSLAQDIRRILKEGEHGF